MPFRWVTAVQEVPPGSARAMRWLLCGTGALVVLALVVPLVACSTECERSAAKVCKAAQEVAGFDFDTFDTCVRNEVSRCRGG